MSELFTSITNGVFTAETYLICVGCALICGIIAAFSASFKSHITKSFLVTLILLPVSVQTVIMMVNGNVGTGVAVMGAFSLVRFRSVPGKAKDIVSIFLTMTAGLACASGYVGIAILFTLIVSLGMIIVVLFPVKSEKALDLRITVPESISFSDAFDDLFEKFTKNYTLVSVKTTNMGSLYKLQYRIELKDSNEMKEFIDSLRCRNGNLEISVSVAPQGVEEL
ncbi:MAG: DUF4956 domain-containing protein [Clostridia bacterium]|nr:DUF4956 domain-containing protein [Clostridia bacterium]